MLRNITERHPVEEKEYRIDFTQDGSGFTFNATPDGKVILENDDQRRNYEYAMSHPELFEEEYNKFTVRKYTYIEPATGVCICGNSVVLVNQYQGACQCDGCGRWYNLFGQELIDPEYWED